MSDEQRQHDYRPEIDGLRAIAVSVVVLYHFGLGCKGGYVGVDIFFVISGFLITKILAGEARSTGSVDLVRFWRRRIRRLLPALLLVSLVIWLVSLVILMPSDFQEMSQSFLWQTGLAANVFFWRKTGYFAGAAEQKPFLHTWSLSVEEQFYLFLPALIAVLSRRPRQLRWVLLVVLAGSFMLSAYTYKRMPSACFYLLPTRAWEFLCGSVVALWGVKIDEASPWHRESFSALGLAMMLLPACFYHQRTAFPGPAAVAPCLGACLFIWANSSTLTWTGRLLSRQPFLKLGLLSYSLYLWHWPVICFLNYVRVGPIEPGIRCLAMLVCLIFAWLAYQFVELPLRRSTWLYSYAFAVSFLSLLTAACLFAISRVSKGFPERFNGEILEAAGFAGHDPFQRDLSLREVESGKLVTFGVETPEPARLIVWGDSHAMSVLPGLDGVFRRRGLRGEAAVHNSSPPILGASLEPRFSQLAGVTMAYNNAVYRHILNSRAKDVLLVAAWEDYFGRDEFSNQVLSTIRALVRDGKRVWVMQEVPVHNLDVAHAFVMAKLQNLDITPFTRSRDDCLVYSSRSRKTFAGVEGLVHLIDPIDFFYPGKQAVCRIALDGHVLYRDAAHLSASGSHYLAQLLEGAIFSP
ncbi:MAG: acyltransferase [Candidatus Eremiobacteraeota bacterium]|nr:acyltransferase [Candidatus Eremiobacteraeota bacterium]